MKGRVRCPRCQIPIRYAKEHRAPAQRITCPACQAQLEVTYQTPLSNLFRKDGKTTFLERYNAMSNRVRTQLFVLVVSLVMCVLFLVLGLLLPA